MQAAVSQVENAGSVILAVIHLCFLPLSAFLLLGIELARASATAGQTGGSGRAHSARESRDES